VLTLISALLISQFPQVECRSNGGVLTCAQTPQGRCVTTNGRDFCGDPSYETYFVLRDPPPVECVTTNGTGACGYDCKTTNGTAACARTPWGRCVTTNGRVFCGDPDPTFLRYGLQPEPLECVTTNGFGACGYDCKTTNGTAACARTPAGACVTTNGRVFCGDPSPAAFSQGQAPPSVQCQTTNGVAACGYDCKTSNGRVACASVPWGRCIARDGNVLCGPSY